MLDFVISKTVIFSFTSLEIVGSVNMAGNEQDKYQDICYAKNYLSEVICRLDFADQMKVFNSTMPREVYGVVRKYYPIAEPQEVVGAQFQVNPISGTVINNMVSKNWVFWARNKESSCSIDSTRVVFSVKKYSVFDSLYKAVSEIMRAILDLNPDCQGKRLGLRYINSLPMKEPEYRIADKYFKALDIMRNDDTLRLYTQMVYYVPETDIRVNLQYGYPNPDFPAKLKNRSFLIDTDAFYQGILFSEDIDEMVMNMHTEAQKCFENMITDSFRKELNSEE